MTSLTSFFNPKCSATVTPHLSIQFLANRTDVRKRETTEQQMVDMKLTDLWEGKLVGKKHNMLVSSSSRNWHLQAACPSGITGVWASSHKTKFEGPGLAVPNRLLRSISPLSPSAFAHEQCHSAKDYSIMLQASAYLLLGIIYLSCSDHGLMPHATETCVWCTLVYANFHGV